MAQLFTLEEANAEVARIRPIVEKIMAIRREIIDKRPEVWPVLAKAAGNGGSQTAARMDQDFHLMHRLVQSILERGAEIKDLDTGLIDFHSIQNGREVLLCWQYGEDQILYWHELDAGFSGRQKL